MVKIVGERVARKLAVEGTAKSAAKSKSSDKHERLDLTIEEATVASPRKTRHRTEPFFGFEDDTIPGRHDKSEHYKAPAAKNSAKSGEAEGTVAKTLEKTRKRKAIAKEVIADASNDETLEDRVVPNGEAKRKRKKSDGGKTKLVVGPSSNTVQIPDRHSKRAVANASGPAKTKADKGGRVNGSGDKQKANAINRENTGDNVKSRDAEKQRGQMIRKSRAGMVAESTEGPAVDLANEKISTEPQAFKANKLSVQKNEKQDRIRRTKMTETKASGVSDANQSKEAEKAHHDLVTISQPSADTSAKPFDATGADALSVDNESKKKDTSSTASKSGKRPTTAKKGQKKNTPASTGPSCKITDVGDVFIQPKDAMDQGPFEHLVSLSDEGKNPINAKVANTEYVTAHTSKQASGHEATQIQSMQREKAQANKSEVPDQAADTALDLVKLAPAVDRKSASESTKAKKRKATSDLNAEALKSDVLDPLVKFASASASKKSKKSRNSMGQTLGGMAAAVGNSLGMNGGAGREEPAFQKSSKGGMTTDADVSQGTNVETTTLLQHDDLRVRAWSNDGGQDGEEPDDQTAALLAGFESDGDDVHALSDAGFKQGQRLPVLPNSGAISKQLKAIKSSEQDLPGVVYVGRIPHGFYEHEMRSYFSQFGDIGHLRLSRSRKTGASKHYAFIEFKNADVAKIVADTMDTYLMFGHVLKCKLVAPGDVHDNMWKGAGKRFKKVPWNKIEGRKLEASVGRDVWDQRVEDEKKRRSTKAAKQMETLGYSFEAPLSGVEQVARRTRKDLTVEDVEQEKSLITDIQAGAESTVSEELSSKGIESGQKKIAAVKRSFKRVTEDVPEAKGPKVKKARKVNASST